MSTTAHITRFCDLARRGKSITASTGENAAYQLAKTLYKLGDDMMILDREAIEGFNQLCLLASGPFPTDADKSAVYQAIAKAAGR